MNLERSEGSTFVILAGCLPTVKEWHGIKVRASDLKRKKKLLKKKHNLVLKVDLTEKS